MMKQIIKTIVSISLLMVVSACASTSQNSEIFSKYEYAPSVSFNNYPATTNYNGGYTSNPFNMNNHH